MLAKCKMRGFTLIATLMLLLIMSGIAIGLLMMVNTEGKVGNQDTQNNLAFHAAEGGIEHMTSDLANMFQNVEAPTAAQIVALSADAPPSTAFMSYPVYSLTPATNANGTLVTNWGQIASGTYQGLFAQLLPVNLQVTASTSLAGFGTVGDEVNMSRTIEVALIPVFQFGVFSDSDLGFFSSPNLNFAGRVHTNGDLYLGVANGFTLTFHDKLTAWGNVIRAVLPNGLAANAFNDSGTVLIPQSSGGCDLPAQPACRAMKSTEGSVTGAGGSPPASGPTVGPPSWQTVSLGAAYYNTFIEDGDYGNTVLGTGATNLTLPFVNGTTGTNTGPQSFEIVRRPPAGESTTGALGASRLYNEAEIRVLLSDTPADLPGGVGDANNIRLANIVGGTYPYGVAASVPAGLPALASGGSYDTYFAAGTTAYPDTSTWTNALFPVANPTLSPDWPYAPLQPIAADITFTNDPGAPLTTLTANANGLTAAPPALLLTPCTNTNPPVCPAAPNPFYKAPYPYYTATAANLTNTWNLIDGYLRVEYRDVNGAYHPITAEWLQLGFARGPTPPLTSGSNPINPNAILIFQYPADRNGSGGWPDQKGAGPTGCVKSGGVWNCIKAKPPEITVDQTTLLPWYGDSKAALQSVSMNNWYPINFYDPREGESRDTQQSNNSCTPNGIMNAVELDVGNLKRWLAGQTGISGPLVDFISQNGYILYFSDRRGMLPNPNGHASGSRQNQDGRLRLGRRRQMPPVRRAIPMAFWNPSPWANRTRPEDVNLNGKLDNFGAGNIGLGFGYGVNNGTASAYIINNSVNRQIVNAALHLIPTLPASACPRALSGKRTGSAAPATR